MFGWFKPKKKLLVFSRKCLEAMELENKFDFDGELSHSEWAKLITQAERDVFADECLKRMYIRDKIGSDTSSEAIDVLISVMCKDPLLKTWVQSAEPEEYHTLKMMVYMAIRTENAVEEKTKNFTDLTRARASACVGLEYEIIERTLMFYKENLFLKETAMKRKNQLFSPDGLLGKAITNAKENGLDDLIPDGY